MAQQAFERLRAIGDASNAGAGGDEALRQACLIAQQHGFGVLDSALGFGTTSAPGEETYLAGLQSSLAVQGRSQLEQAFNAGCAALMGETASGDLFNPEQIKRLGIAMVLDESEAALRNFVGPYVKRLELETGYDGDAFTWEALAVVPLWKDGQQRDHIFTQLSMNRRTDDGDTYNAGLVWRRLNADKTIVYGLNTFFDHAADMNHNRMSVGADLQTSELGVSANRYIPVSDWKSLDVYEEERAASGWDLELQGRLLELPSWQASLKGFQWSSNDAGESEDVYGYDAAVQWKPINAMEVEAGMRDEQSASPEYYASLRLVYRFGDAIGEVTDRPTRLASVEERVYDKVRRENRVRTEKRIKDSAFVTVSETIGANTALLTSGAVTLSTGRQLPRPFTLNVSAAGGSAARLLFRDGAVLTVGANSQVRIEAALITLISGQFQYVSGSTNVLINVPGGTVTLHGTDVDVSTDGANSVLRVRDGGATLTGTVSGSATLAPGEAAETTGGVAGALAPNDAVFITHADTISTTIDRVASAQAGDKVAPYAIDAPRLTTTATVPGQAIAIGLKFNTAVTASDGPPRLILNINGNTRYADLSGGSGTDDLVFNYTLQAGDAGASTITVQSLDLNGATLTGNGKNAVTTIADATLDLMGSVTDVTAPSGYAVSFTTDPIDITNQDAAAFQITGAEVGATFDYTISSSNGGTPVSGRGTVASATQDVEAIDLSSLPDGTLTLSLTLTDTAANAGAAATDTVIKDILYLAMNFVDEEYELGGTSHALASLPGWTFSRASPATTYAEDSSGNLVAFAANTPRITDKGLLIESSRTNLVKESQELVSPTWNLALTTVSNNVQVAPDGTMTADVVTESGGVFPIQGFSWQNGVTYTYSVYAKAITDDTFGMRIQNAITSPPQDQLVLVNLTSGTATYNPGNKASTSTVNIAPAGNGYYRISMTFVANVSQVGYFALQGASGVAFWGAQLEQGYFATSYIPTTTASVTRSADNPRMTGLTVQSDYTAYAEFARNTLSSIASARLIGMGNTGSRASVTPLASTTTSHTAFNTLDGNTSAASGLNQAVRKVAGISTTTPPSRRLVSDGRAVVGDSGASPMTSTIYLGSESGSSQQMNTYLRDIRIYATAKTDAELQSMTAP